MKLKLLPWISFDHDLHLMIHRPHGIFDEEHLEKTVAMLEKVEAEADKPFNRYTDLSKVDAVDISLPFIFRIALHRRLACSNNSPVKSAFYVTGPATEKVAKVYAVLTDHSPLQVKMFKEVEEAAKWLGVTVQDLEMENLRSRGMPVANQDL